MAEIFSIAMQEARKYLINAFNEGIQWKYWISIFSDIRRLKNCIFLMPFFRKLLDNKWRKEKARGPRKWGRQMRKWRESPGWWWKGGLKTTVVRQHQGGWGLLFILRMTELIDSLNDAYVLIQWKREFKDNMISKYTKARHCHRREKERKKARIGTKPVQEIKTKQSIEWWHSSEEKQASRIMNLTVHLSEKITDCKFQWHILLKTCSYFIQK